MLKITNSYTTSGQRWTLCGQLTGVWVGVLRSAWESVRGTQNGARYVVDLRDVTYIDESGEELLREMKNNGVELAAAGIKTKYIVENL